MKPRASLATIAIVVMAAQSLAGTEPTPILSQIIGVWELTGIGTKDNMGRSEKVMMGFAATGELRMAVRERPLARAVRGEGTFSIAGDAVTIRFEQLEKSEDYRVEFEDGLLILIPVRSGKRPAPPLFFERRPFLATP